MSSHPTSASDQDGFPGSPVSDNSKFKIQNSKLVFVCVGAGQSSRFGVDKLVQTLGEKTVFAAALEALESACPAADMVVVVAPEKIDFWCHRLAGQFPRARFAAGAEHRHGSVRAGVTAAVGLGAEIVAIHDAARPLVDPRDVQNLVRGLGDADGAILTGKVTDTVKRIDRDGVVVETVDRQNLGFALTPQVFRVSSLQAAWRKTGHDGDWTDESAILESAGMQVRSVVARYPNPKLTSPPDLELIRALAGVPS